MKNAKKLSLKKKYIKILIIISIIILTCNSTLVADTKAPSDVFVDPVSQTVEVGDSFDIYVNCSPDQPIRAYQFSLSFDPLLIQCDSVVEGDIFNGYTTFFGYVDIDNTVGVIELVYNAIVGAGNIIEPGSFAVISFSTVDGPGTSILDLYSVKVEDEIGPVTISVFDGSVTITMSDIPPTADYSWVDTDAGGSVL